MRHEAVAREKRRRFLKSIPAAAGTVLLHTPRAVAEEHGGITKDTLRCGEALDSVAFSDAEHDLMLQNVAANRGHYETLRGVEVGYDVAPAFSFEPYARHGRPAGRATPNAPIEITPGPRSRPRDDETLAFLPRTALAPL